MNKELILELAREIEDLDYEQLRMGTWLENTVERKYEYMRDRGYDPDKDEEPGEHCGTSGCIAGWTVALHDPHWRALMDLQDSGGYRDQDVIAKRAQELLDIDYASAHELFFGVEDVTADCASACLIILAHTGDVHWHLAMEMAYEGNWGDIEDNGYKCLDDCSCKAFD